MIRTIFFYTAFFANCIAWMPLLTVGLISRRVTRILIRMDVGCVLWLARTICGIRYIVHYPPTEENGIPFKPNENTRTDGKAIIAAKHMSLLEIAILYQTVPNAFFIIKREITWIPIYGWAFLRLGFQPVNRTRGKTNMKKLETAVAKKIMDGGVLVIFPEGTRVKPGVRIPLKRGLMFIAHELKLPILPVGTDAGLYWPKRGKMRAGTANVYFEELLPCNASLDDIAAAINRHSA